jgi:hypothetical protein
LRITARFANMRCGLISLITKPSGGTIGVNKSSVG